MPRAATAKGGAQQGGTRGSSNQGGPERSGEPEKDQAAGVNQRRDAGSRASQGRADSEERSGGEDRPREQSRAPRGPLPKGARPEDYLGGSRPHKTRRRRTRGASGVKNEVA